MLGERETDWFWYWLGLSMGINSKKKLKESPQIIRNYGKQGVKVKLTPIQQDSLIRGIECGCRFIVENLNVSIDKQYQYQTDYKSFGDYLTIGIGGVKTARGQVITLPIYIANNSADNRGFCGYQLKIKYNPTHLSFQSITPSSLWTSSFDFLHDAQSGVVQVQGMRDEVGYEDMVIGAISFIVNENAPSNMSVDFQGPKGKDNGTNLITKINGENYYIMPLNTENAEIVIKGEKEKTNKDIVYSDPIGDSSDIYGEEVDFEYDFELELEHIKGSGDNRGANVVIEIDIGGTKQQVIIPVEEGTNRYKGKVPLRLPSISTGPITITVRVEPEDEADCYYWFIKAGALWGFSSEIPRENANQIPVLEPIKRMFERFRLYDGYLIYTEGGSIEPSEPILADIEIGEIMQLFDDFGIDTEGLINKDGADGFGISDGFIIYTEGV